MPTLEAFCPEGRRLNLRRAVEQRFANREIGTGKCGPAKVNHGDRVVPGSENRQGPVTPIS